MHLMVTAIKMELFATLSVTLRTSRLMKSLGSSLQAMPMILTPLFSMTVIMADNPPTHSQCMQLVSSGPDTVGDSDSVCVVTS